ncbi:hypothetical protein [Actinomycetospora cinnamomea]|uniref:hypothetical protein n=1 Tax=Actinomycetospora cinnamomea TaxID=663609 RepID=UPI000E31C4F8|nr:hypothetical protein [Actinomycetospora cinnamomea]
MSPLRLLSATLAAAVALLTVLALVVALVRPGPPGLWAYVDVLEAYNLPTWFGAALLLVTAGALVVAGAAARAAGVRGAWWWYAAAVGPAVASLCVGTGLHTRVDGLARQAVGENALTTDWLPAAVVIGLVLAVPFGVLARYVPHGRRMIAAVAVFAGGALGSELLVRALGDGGRALAVVAEGVQLAGAAGLLLVAVTAVRLAGDGPGVRLVSTTPAGADPLEPGEPRRWPLWAVAIAVTAGLSALSLVANLAFPDPGPKLAPWIGYLDVDNEGNLPTWWSVGLLVSAAVAHLVTGLTARREGAPASTGWFVGAFILLGMSLDDMTTIHERVGDMVRPEGAGAAGAEGGNFSFYWVVPGAGVALLIAIALGALALKLRGRPRWLLVGGLGVLFFFALGVEGIQGALIAAGGGGQTLQVLGYHVEELGENAGALLLTAAATAALAVRRRAGALDVRYAGHGIPAEDPSPVEPAPDTPTEVFAAVPVSATAPIRQR